MHFSGTTISCETLDWSSDRIRLLFCTCSRVWKWVMSVKVAILYCFLLRIMLPIVSYKCFRCWSCLCMMSAIGSEVVSSVLYWLLSSSITLTFSGGSI